MASEMRPPETTVPEPPAGATASPYTARLLPPPEWDRLPAMVAGALHPDHALVIVVEDLDGSILAHWCALNTVHLEGLYVDPIVRGNPVVARMLVLTMIAALKGIAVKQALTIAESDAIRELAAKLGFTHVPGTLHRLDL